MISTVPLSALQDQKKGRSSSKVHFCAFCKKPYIPMWGKGLYCYREECFQAREQLRRLHAKQHRESKKGK